MFPLYLFIFNFENQSAAGNAIQLNKKNNKPNTAAFAGKCVLKEKTMSLWWIHDQRVT